MSRFTDLFVIAGLGAILFAMLWDSVKKRFFAQRPIIRLAIMGFITLAMLGLIFAPETHTSTQPVTIKIPIPYFTSSQVAVTGRVPLLSAGIFAVQLAAIFFLNATDFVLNTSSRSNEADRQVIRPVSNQAGNFFFVAAFTLLYFKWQVPNYFANNEAGAIFAGLALMLCAGTIAISNSLATRGNAMTVYAIASVALAPSLFVLFWL